LPQRFPYTTLFRSEDLQRNTTTHSTPADMPGGAGTARAVSLARIGEAPAGACVPGSPPAGRLRHAPATGRAPSVGGAEAFARQSARPDRAGLDSLTGIVGIPVDAGWRLRAGHADSARASGEAFARSSVLPDPERRHRPSAAAERPRCGIARRARATACRRSLYVGRRSTVHRHLRVPERRGAPVQSVLLRSGESRK